MCQHALSSEECVSAISTTSIEGQIVLGGRVVAGPQRLRAWDMALHGRGFGSRSLSRR